MLQLFVSRHVGKATDQILTGFVRVVNSPEELYHEPRVGENAHLHHLLANETNHDRRHRQIRKRSHAPPSPSLETPTTMGLPCSA